MDFTALFCLLSLLAKIPMKMYITWIFEKNAGTRNPRVFKRLPPMTKGRAPNRCIKGPRNMPGGETGNGIIHSTCMRLTTGTPEILAKIQAVSNVPASADWFKSHKLAFVWSYYLGWPFQTIAPNMTLCSIQTLIIWFSCIIDKVKKKSKLHQLRRLHYLYHLYLDV